MKTIPIPQFQAKSLDDITFENRNHAYGAYTLRKNYGRHLFWSFFIAFSLFSLTIAMAFRSANKKQERTVVLDKGQITISPPPKIITPPPPPPTVRSLIKNIIFTPPIVVDSIKAQLTSFLVRIILILH